MLVLSRKTKEDVRLGDSIVVKVLEIRGDRVKLGLVAPLETKIRRGELQPKDREE